MSEAELHVLNARLRGGILNKARRGELEIRLPVGLVYDAGKRVRLDPDRRVQDSVRQLFRTFQRTGPATATVKTFREQGLQFPRRATAGPHKGEVLWSDLDHSRALSVLHNPRYAGAYTFGRSRQRKLPDGRIAFKDLPQSEWIALVREAHEGYLGWHEYEQNLQRLRQNGHLYGEQRECGAPREGPALLQGLLICASCGERMTVRYNRRSVLTRPIYVCQRQGIRTAQPICQWVSGRSLDQAIGRLLVERVTPMALQAALAVQTELEARSLECDALRRQQIEQARYHSDLARRRYMQVDPDHRLVADTLEAEWNASLRALEQAQQRYEKQRQADAAGVDAQQRAAILQLARDFPRLWNDPRTPQLERKRMARLIIADITLLKGAEITAQVRFNGGTTHTVHLPRPQSAWQLRQTPPAVVEQIDQLLDEHTDGEVAARLNAQRSRSGEGRAFSRLIVRHIRLAYHLRSRYERLRARGLLTLDEIARQLDVHPGTVKLWRRAGLLRAHRFGDRGEYLFETPGANAPIKHRHQGKMQALAAATRPSSHASDR